MKENKNGQQVQGNLTDKKGKQNNETEANPKREGNTPEKITPVENKKDEQTGNLKNQKENERPDKRKTPVANENNNGKNNEADLNTPKGDLNEGSNGNKPDSRKDGNKSEKSKTPILDREDDATDQEGELEENDDLNRYKNPVAETDDDEDEDADGENREEEEEMPSYNKN